MQRSKLTIVYYLILPAVIMELAIHVIPMLLGLGIAFKDVTQRTILNWINADFIGLNNFILSLDPSRSIGRSFYASIVTTFKYGVSAKILHFALGLWGALLVHRQFKGRAFFRTLFLIPLAIPSFISAISWRFMFLQEWGLINTLLVDHLHLVAERPQWLVGDNALWAIIIAQVWRGWSFHYVMILAALQAIPEELYEAVDIDGGSNLAKFRHVTFPYLKPILKVLLVVNGLRIFNEFETAFVMMGERPPAAADVVSLHVYNQAFINWNFGLASAMAISWVVILAAIAFILAKTTRIHHGEDL